MRLDPICETVFEMAGTQIDLQSQAVLAGLRLRFWWLNESGRVQTVAKAPQAVRVRPRRAGGERERHSP